MRRDTSKLMPREWKFSHPGVSAPAEISIRRLSLKYEGLRLWVSRHQGEKRKNDQVQNINGVLTLVRVVATREGLKIIGSVSSNGRSRSGMEARRIPVCDAWPW